MRIEKVTCDRCGIEYKDNGKTAPYNYYWLVDEGKICEGEDKDFCQACRDTFWELVKKWLKGEK